MVMSDEEFQKLNEEGRIPLPPAAPPPAPPVDSIFNVVPFQSDPMDEYDLETTPRPTQNEAVERVIQKPEVIMDEGIDTPGPELVAEMVAEKLLVQETAEYEAKLAKPRAKPTVKQNPLGLASPRRGPTKHQATRMNPDTPKILGLAVFLVFVLMVSSFIVSFFGIWGVSQETTNLPGPITWLPALFLDVAILAYTISYFVFRARSEPVIRTRIALWFFATLSVGANIAHTLDGVTADMSSYSVAIGLMITASAPIAVVISTEEVARLAFETPKKKAKRRARIAKRKAV